MLKNRLFSSAIVIAGGLFATSALANEGQKAGQQAGMEHGSAPSFQEVDVDGDGYISEVELKDSAAYQAELSDIDSDNDGRVTETEFAAFEAKVVEQGQQGQQSQRGQQSAEEYQTDPTEDLGETEDY